MIAALLLFSVVIARFPTLFEAPPVWAQLFPAFVFAVPVAILLPQRRPLAIRPGELTLCALYLLLLFVSFARAAGSNAILVPQSALSTGVITGLLATFAVLALLGPLDDRARRTRMLLVALSPGLYVAVNIGLLLLGLEAPLNLTAAERGGQQAQLLGLAGIDSQRTRFPLAAGVNNFGVIAGLAFAMAAVLVIRQKGTLRVVASGAALCSLYGLLAVDSRGGFLFALTAVALILLLPRALQRGVSGLALLIPAGPAIILGLLGLLSGTALADVFSRGPGEFSTSSARGDVWATVIGFLAQPRLEHLWGYGAWGQITSEVSYSYAYLFQGFPVPESGSAHNFALQTILEIGYIGLAVVLMLLFSCVRGAARTYTSSPTPENAALLGGILFVILIGLVEAAPTIAYPDSFAAFVVLSVACLRYSRPAPEPLAIPPRGDREVDARAVALR